jgi:hypothetical protein
LGWFLIMSLLPLAVYGYASINNGVKTVKNDVMIRLISVADDKIQRIRDHFLEIEKNVTSLAQSPTIINTLREFKTVFEKGKMVSSDNRLFSYNYSAIEKGFVLFYTPGKESTRYHDLFLISPEGDVVYTATKGDDFGTNLITGLYKDSELAQVFKRAKTLL